MTEITGIAARAPRADAQRNIDSLLEAAKTVFAASGVDAPAKEITDLAGVGVGTLYRHFPVRSDLISAVFRREIDACAEEAPRISASHAPDEALELWLRRYTEFVATKQGLAVALHSGDPAFNALPVYFQEHLGPPFRALLENAEAAGAVGEGHDPIELLGAVANLCIPASGLGDASLAHQMVTLLVNGLRYEARG